ncbi:hypothetical protein NL676_024982 [Syzygium grande]|nr:hypothetical protein NL676_024982 [Syzygium grande]
MAIIAVDKQTQYSLFHLPLSQGLETAGKCESQGVGTTALDGGKQGGEGGRCASSSGGSEGRRERWEGGGAIDYGVNEGGRRWWRIFHVFNKPSIV